MEDGLIEVIPQRREGAKERWDICLSIEGIVLTELVVCCINRLLM